MYSDAHRTSLVLENEGSHGIESLSVIQPRCACGSKDAIGFVGYERQFGSNDRFRYYQCLDCGSLRIASIPGDLSRYYPSNYYSFHGRKFGKPAAWKPFIARWLIQSPDPIAKHIAGTLKYRRYAFFHWGRLAAATLDAKILDFGCGNGELLQRMRHFGFRCLSGIDPFTPADVRQGGLEIRRANKPRPKEAFDLIMMNHVLEHLADPLATLSLLKGHLSDRGRILVRIPLAGSYAHWRYGLNWVNLDVPRHLFIPSLTGFGHIARQAGLEVIHQEFDGEEPSLLLSESYSAGRSMSTAIRPPRADRRRYRRFTRHLNSVGAGDLGLFVLKKMDEVLKQGMEGMSK